MAEYGIMALVFVAVVALYYIIAPRIKGEKAMKIFAIAEQIVIAVKQTNPTPENETEEEKQARHELMKSQAMEALKQISNELGIKTVSDTFLDNAIEAAVWLMNQTGKFQ